MTMRMLFLRVSSLFIAFTVLAMCFFTGADLAGSPYAPARGDVRMNAVILSDTHTNDKSTHDHNRMLAGLFGGVSKSKKPLDAVVIAGDLTETATAREYLNLQTLIHRSVKNAAVLPALGNHDVRGDMSQADYDANISRYYDFCRSFGVGADKPYWSKTVNGYRFIVLGSETEEKDRTHLSDEQMVWLDEELRRSEADGKPAFIVCHQVIDHTNNVDEIWRFEGSIGEQSDEVLSIIRRHTDRGLTVVFISGHLHAAFTEYSFESPCKNLYCLNLPSALYTEEAGMGCTLEAYDNCLLIRARNFIAGEWLPNAYNIPLR